MSLPRLAGILTTRAGASTYPLIFGRRTAGETRGATVGDTAGRVEVLGGLALFAKMSSEELEQVAGLVEVVEVPAATDVVTQGDAGDALWILAEGEVRVSASDAELRTLQAPAYFGEVATLTGIPRVATVSTTAPSTLWRIASEQFLDVIGRPSAE